MTREEAKQKLKEYQRMDNPEAAHCIAVVVLCDLLVSLGYEDVVEAWFQIEKRYVEFVLGTTPS